MTATASNSDRDPSSRNSKAPSWEAWVGYASQRATSAFALRLPRDVAGAAMISSASGCISRSSSEIRAWATSQPVRWIATASEAVLSSTSARAARIRGAQVSQASMCSRKSFSNRSPIAISVASVAVDMGDFLWGHPYRDIDYLSHGNGPHASGPGRATARNALRDWNSVPILVEGKAGGFATSEEFLCHV